eukprot:CAMPEP_0119490670 /NCGR_PEP_ID=MMETSP1344-20130328/15774_1 /TAXON_ID=236787 /ORGANISM="Florenciella parvula, Strain CCMP2471" /LENGTH=101 /DNA_ID=CAMNT_0007525855 /DNA_START=206 /DNA_END=507 /DNA_ORIENTATION=-
MMDTTSTPPHELLRAVAYVCMTPAKLADPTVIDMRRVAYEDRTTTSHWPSDTPDLYWAKMRDTDEAMNQQHGKQELGACTAMELNGFNGFNGFGDGRASAV